MYMCVFKPELPYENNNVKVCLFVGACVYRYLKITSNRKICK